MENLNVNPTLAEGDLLELSPMKLPNSILKPSQKDNLILLQTPVHKHLKVSFITPKRTPAQGQMRAPLGTISTNILHDNSNVTSTTGNPTKMGILPPNLMGDLTSGNMPVIKKAIVPRRPGLSSEDITATKTEQPNLNDEKKPPEKQKMTENKWESLRKLDENLRWRERVEVITKLDHKEYTQCAKDYIGEMIDKAVDISVANSNQASSNVMTPITKVMTSISRVASNDSNVISPIAKSAPTKPDILTPGSEVMTPITKSGISLSNMETTEFNNTFDVSSHGTFLVENGNESFLKNEVKIPKIETTEKSAIGGTKLTGLKVPSGLKKPSSVSPKQTHLTNTRSQSVSDTCQNVIGTTDIKHEFKIGARSYSFDLDNIPENCDPFKPGDVVGTRENRQESTTNPVANNTVDVSATGSVFETSTQAPSFAMRPIDSAFDDTDFMDGSKLLDQGHLDFDYLEQKTSGNVSADLRKQSLYMKFDPLLEGLSSRQSLHLLGRKSDIIDFTGRVTPLPEDDAEEATVSPREPDLLCDSPSQIGAENVTLDNSHIQRGSASDSIGSASPSLQNSAFFNKPDSGIIEVLKYSEEDIQRVLKRKKTKWSKERNEYISRCSELKNTFEQVEILAKDLDARCDEAQNKATESDKKIAEKTASLKEEKQLIDAEILSITSKSSALLQRTETLQKMSTNFQANEQKQKEHAKDLRAKYAHSQKKIIELETESAQNLKKTQSEKSAIEATHTVQLSSIQAKIRAVELRLKSLQTTLDRKKNENHELMQICDELLANSGAQ